MNGRTWGIVTVLLVTSVALATPPVPIHSVVIEPETVAGVGDVIAINNMGVNGFGQWIVEANTNGVSTSNVVVLTGYQFTPFAVAYQEGQALSSPAGATISSFDALNINDSGNTGWNLFLSGPPSNMDSGIFFNDQLVFQESSYSTAAGLSPNTPFIGFFEAKINNNNDILVMASVDDPAIATTVDRALIKVSNPGGAYTETLIAKESDEIEPGVTIADFETGPHDFQIANDGGTMYTAKLVGTGVTTANDLSVWVNGNMVAREGNAGPAGRNYEFLSRTADSAANGNWVLKANLDGDTTNDEVLIKNGAIWRSEGDPIPGQPGTSIVDFGLTSGPVDIDDDGNVLWAATWSDGTATHKGLFYNDLLLVEEDVDYIDGVLLDSLSLGEDGFKLSDHGGWIIFEANLLGGLNGAFLLQVPEPATLGLLALALVTLRRR